MGHPDEVDSPPSIRRPSGTSLVLDSILPFILSGFDTDPSQRAALSIEFADPKSESPIVLAESRILEPRITIPSQDEISVSRPEQESIRLACAL
jgi:hypothetical protein